MALRAVLPPLAVCLALMATLLPWWPDAAGAATATAAHGDGVPHAEATSARPEAGAPLAAQDHQGRQHGEHSNDAPGGLHGVGACLCCSILCKTVSHLLPPPVAVIPAPAPPLIGISQRTIRPESPPPQV